VSLLDILIPRAREAEAVIVLAEGQDPRVIRAAREIVRRGIAGVIVLATPDELAKASDAAGVSLAQTDVQIVDFQNSEYAENFAEEFHRLRSHKGLSVDQARQIMKNRLYFGNMMVRQGMAQGMVAGSIASTPDMLRAAFRCIGTAPGYRIASSCFMMDLTRPTPGGEDILAYADCGVTPDPGPQQLVDIAAATAETFTALTGRTARVAFLSFSTHGSARHPLVNKVARATLAARERFTRENNGIICDGEIQADAAIVPDVAAKKCPDSELAGRANVLIFPDLQSGNICYKLTERLAGARAYGPIIQGLAHPVNDLSRGCSAEDIVGVAAITVCQAARLK